MLGYYVTLFIPKIYTGMYNFMKEIHVYIITLMYQYQGRTMFGLLVVL